MKYEIIAKDYTNGGEIDGLKFSEKMEALAADFIKERELDIDVDDLWNDATADQAREAMYISLDNGGIFYADDFFESLVD